MFHTGKSTRSYAFASIGLLLSTVLVLSAWTAQTSENDNTSTLTSPNPVEVVLQDEALELSQSELAAGPVVFEVTNDGSEPHSFAVQGAVEKGLEGKIEAGETETLEVTLEAGSYMAYCPIEGHSEKESVEFTVGE